MNGARLDVEGLGKRFRGLRAVHEVSFTVPAGAIHALIGPNGAGKTTIFNMIAGVYPPDAGELKSCAAHFRSSPNPSFPASHGHTPAGRYITITSNAKP